MSKAKDEKIYRIDPKLYHLATQEHKKEFERLQAQAEEWQITKKDYDEHCVITAKILEENTKRIQQDIDKIEHLQAELAKHRWRPVSEEPPEQKRIFVLIAGKNSKGQVRRQATVAMYIGERSVLAEDWLDDDCPESFYESDYDKENDCYWTPSGFYEYQMEADRSYFISEATTHWMPIFPPENT